MFKVCTLRIGCFVTLTAMALTLWSLSSEALAQDALAAATAMQEKPESNTEATEAQKRLQTALDQLRDKYGLPALWAGKFYADGRAVVGASGVRKWHTAASAQPDDAVHIGSCTKAMTAVMVAQLCSKGSLSLETKLSDIFRDEEGLADSAWGQVTVTDLLQHRSGAPANADWQKLDADHPDDAVAARRAMLKWLIERRRPGKPAFVYSNVGYALLGHIVETIEGQAWESLIKTRLFEPLEMKSAGLGPLGKTETDGQPTNAWGHTVASGFWDLLGGIFGKSKTSDSQPIQIDNAPPLGPAGLAHMNLSDWSKFVLLFAADKGYEKLGIEPEIWSRLLEPGDGGNYAAGWRLIEREWAGGRTLFHNGSNTTWYCVVFVAPEKGYCLLAATNVFSSSAPKACDRAVAAADELEF